MKRSYKYTSFQIQILELAVSTLSFSQKFLNRETGRPFISSNGHPTERIS